MLKQNNNDIDEDDFDLDPFSGNSDDPNPIASRKESALAFASEKNGFNKQQVMNYITSLRSEYQKMTDQYRSLSSQTQNMMTKNQNLMNENNQLKSAFKKKKQEIALLHQQQENASAKSKADTAHNQSKFRKRAHRHFRAYQPRGHALNSSGKLIIETFKGLQDIISDAVARF